MKMKIGIGLMARGAGVGTAWAGWTRRRWMDPVDEPISVAAGQSLKQSFRLNYDGLYLIELTVDPSGSGDKEAAETGAEWVLRGGTREIARGVAPEGVGGPDESKSFTRVIGQFLGQARKEYSLEIKFSRDMRSLQGAKPRLKVMVSGLAKENLDAASVLLFSIVFICELFGLILVGVGISGKHKALP